MKRRTGIVFILAMLVLCVASYAQDAKKESQLRTVRGVVVDKSESTVQGRRLFEEFANQSSSQLHCRQRGKLPLQRIGPQRRLRSARGKRRRQIADAASFEL